MRSPGAVRAHILSIRDTPADEKLIETIWCADPEIALHHVDCGAEALTYLQGKQQKLPNLIVLAWRFNESQLSASETLHALKADAILRAVPVVVLAGHLSVENIDELYAAGVACVFHIPSDLDALETVLREIKNLWLNKARLPSEKNRGCPAHRFAADAQRTATTAARAADHEAIDAAQLGSGG